MAKRTSTIVLEGREYVVHAFNIGELERLADIMREQPPHRWGFAMLRIALERADPKPDDVSAIEPSREEYLEASKSIGELAGVQIKSTADVESGPREVAA